MLAPSCKGALLKNILPNRATDVSASIIVPVAAISDSIVSRSNTSNAPVFEREKRTAVSAASIIDFSTAFFQSSLLRCFVNILIYFL